MGENRPELLANETLYQLSYDPAPTAGGEMADRRPDGKRGIPERVNFGKGRRTRPEKGPNRPGHGLGTSVAHKDANPITLIDFVHRSLA